MGVDNVQIEGSCQIDHLFFDKNPDPVLGFVGEPDGFYPENPLLRNLVGVLDGKNRDPVSPFNQLVLQCPDYGNHPVYLRGVSVTENPDIHMAYYTISGIFCHIVLGFPGFIS
jgi:hypothetical protein